MRLPLLCNYTFIAAVLAANHLSAAEPVTLTFQNGVNGYTGTFDRRITKTGGTDGSTLTAADSNFSIDGGSATVDDSAVCSLLFRFDGAINSIPAGALILEAKITTVTKTAGDSSHSGDGFSVYRLTRPFDSNSGPTDFGSDLLIGDIDLLGGSFHGPNVLGQASVVSADVTNIVQSWVNGAPNYGFGVRDDNGTNGWNLHASGSTTVANRPKLEITYVVDPDLRVDEFRRGLNGDTESMDIYPNGKEVMPRTNPRVYVTQVGTETNEVFMDGLNPANTAEPDISGMLRFANIDSRLQGRKIESAKLRLVTGFSSSDANSAGPFTVHRMMIPFTASNAYADFAGASGAMLSEGQISAPFATFTNMGNGEVVEVDVTEAVKTWASGETNHGFYIGSGTPNGWQIFTMGAAGLTPRGIDMDAAIVRPTLRVLTSPALPVEIVDLAASSRLTHGTPVQFHANASATAPVTVNQVEFFINGQSIGVDMTAPYSVSYPASDMGNFTLTAVMTDSNGLPTTSEAVNFSVVPPAGLGGLYFDGLTDHIALGDAAELKLSTFTVETWFRKESSGIATTTGTGGVVAIPLVAKGRNQADNSTLDTNWFLGIRESDGVLCADFEGGTGTNVPVSGKTAVAEGEWHHAAVSFDGTHLRIYLDGNLEGVVASNGIMPRADSIQHASIATAMNSNGLGEGAFGGFMDEIRVWNTGRTQAQIRQTINSEVATAEGLVARFALSEGSGRSITSSAPAASVGNFLGAPIWTTGASFNNNVLPSVVITTPATNEYFANNASVDFTVAVADPDGSVARVEYFDHGVSIGVVNSAPFSFSYANPPLGQRVITAQVTDNSGGKSWVNDAVVVNVTFPGPVVPGYTAGIIDGKDEELLFGIPAAIPAPWEVVASSASPYAFTGLGTDSGDIAANVNGSPLAFNAGILLTTNTVVNGNMAAADNIVSPYNAGGTYRVASMDNNGPGETQPVLSPESSSFSLGWFPFNQGWIGANFAADGSIIAGSTNLPPSVSVARTAAGTYTITGLPLTGNLLAVSTGSANDNCATTRQVNNNWVVTNCDNNGSNEDGDFAILYVPALAQRVLSGKVGAAAEFTPLNLDAAAVGVKSAQTPQGYLLTFGDGSVINPSNTALFITADGNAGNGPDNIWHYSAAGNSFVVFSHDLPGLNLAFQTGGFRFLAVPLDTPAPGANEVVISALDANAAEDGSDQQLAFTVTRTGSTATNLTVNYTVGGTATQGSDFASIPGSVVIPAGYSSAVINVQVLHDSLLEQTETVAITIAAGSGYTPGVHSVSIGRIRDAAIQVESTTVEFQQGLNGYTGSFQKRVGVEIKMEGDPALPVNYYTETLGSAVPTIGVDGENPDVNDMIRFDGVIGSGQGQVPAGARVLKAELILSTGTGTNDRTNGPFVVDRLISEFGPTSTYVSVSGNSESRQGVRGIMPATLRPVAGFPISEQGQVVAADVTRIVREWASGEPNHGMGIFAAGTSDGWVYGSISNTNVSLRPKLVVTYTTVPVREYTLEADQSSRLDSRSGASPANGHDLDTASIHSQLNDSAEAMLRFPVDAIPAGEEIVKAELLIRTAAGNHDPAGQTTGTIDIRQVLKDWTPTTNFGANGTVEGTHVGESVTTLTGLGQASTTWVDVTSIVNSWRAGAPNYGINLTSRVADQWVIYWPGTSWEQSAPRLRITTRATGTDPVDDPVDLWAESFGAGSIDLNSDDDGDGIKALVEYALGLSPTAKSVLPGITRNGNEVGITFPKGTHAASDNRVTYEIWSSPNLVSWNLEPLAVQTSSAISISEPPTALGGKKFYRLKVIYTPAP